MPPEVPWRHGKPKATYLRSKDVSTRERLRREKKLNKENLEKENDIEKCMKPLAGKAVCLDLVDYRRIVSFKDNIIQLGARVETFLSKDIDYLITNQERNTTDDIIKKRAALDLSPISPSQFDTPSPFNHSPNVNDLPARSVSRGRAMLQNARVVKSQVSLIENAYNWGVKVVYLDTALRWIQKEKEKLKKFVKLSKSPKVKEIIKKTTSLSPIVHNLGRLFIKCESSTTHFAPQFSEYDRWPSINVDTPHGSCPFDGRYMGQDPVKDRGHLNVTLSSTETLQTCRTPTVGGGGRGNDSFEINVTTIGDLQRSALQKRKIARKKGYCECCHVSYSNIDHHVVTNSHKLYISDPNNFVNLDELISSCPDTQLFLNSIGPLTEQRNIDQQNCDETDAILRRSPRKHYSSQQQTPNKQKHAQKHSPRARKMAKHDLERTPRKREVVLRCSPRNKYTASTPSLRRTSSFVKLSPSLRNLINITPQNITLDIRTPSKNRFASPRSRSIRASTKLTRSFSANLIQTLGPLGSPNKVSDGFDISDDCSDFDAI